MESLILSFNSVMPIFLLMLTGYILKAVNIADKKGFDTVNRLVFKAFLPTLLFYNIYKTESADVVNPGLMIFTVAGTLIVFAVGYASVFILTKDNAKRGVMLQGFFRSNYAILGLPLVEYICEGKTSGLSSLMVAVIVPLFNVLAVISLERFRDGKLNIPKMLKGVLTNTLIIGCLLGLVFYLAGIKLPDVVEKAVSDVAKIASPLAIIVLGASFTFSSLRGCVKELCTVVAARLVIVPAIAIFFAVLLGFTGEALACVLIAFGAPVAVSSFSMAQQMGGDEALAAQVVVVSSALCLLTLFGWIFLLNSMGLF
ncbi:MAG: AEC family transporter [Ruminococcaceae bacterium]|nr:AEC family transporter [Oscillospiraceae bacterium]